METGTKTTVATVGRGRKLLIWVLIVLDGMRMVLLNPSKKNSMRFAAAMHAFVLFTAAGGT